MDKIFEVGVVGRCDGYEKTEWPRRTDKSRTLKNKNKTNFCATVNIWENIRRTIYNYVVSYKMCNNIMPGSLADTKTNTIIVL